MATAFAAASHLAAGGQVPPVLLVLLSLALSGPVCMALAGRVLSRSLLLAGVLVSQGVFHLIFTVAGSVTTVVDATHHAALSSPPVGPALVLQAQAHAVHGGTGMLVFHVLAAAATYGFLRHGEVALVGLLDALRLRVPPAVRQHRMEIPSDAQGGSPRMRRQSMALAAPISRATRVGWFARFKQPYRIADLTVGARRAPPAEILADGPACGHRAGHPIPLDLQLHLCQDGRNGAAPRRIRGCLPTPPRPGRHTPPSFCSPALRRRPALSA